MRVVVCDAMRTAPHAVNIPSTAIPVPLIVASGPGPTIGNTPPHFGHVTLCPMPDGVLPSREKSEKPSMTTPPCEVLSLMQMTGLAMSPYVLAYLPAHFCAGWMTQTLSFEKTMAPDRLASDVLAGTSSFEFL